MNNEQKRKQAVAQWIVFALVTAGLLISIVIGAVSSHLSDQAEKEPDLTDPTQTDHLPVPEIPRIEYETTVSESEARPAIDVSVMTRSSEPTVIGGYIEYLTQHTEE